jgi:hypothetical protein
MVVASKEIIQQITKEAALLDPLDQQLLLTRLRVKRLKRKGTGIMASPPENLKKPTMKQIDKWKHEARLSS